MNRKLKFMFPDVKTARSAWKAMLLACVENRHIHFLATPGTHLGKLQPANVLETTDTMREGKRGIAIGAALGLLAGVLALVFPPWYSIEAWPVILAVTVTFGAVFGAVGMALLGVNLHNPDVANLNDRITRGEVLMIVSVPLSRVKEIRRIVAAVHRGHAENHAQHPASPVQAWNT